MKNKTDVLIIGGGIAGVSTLYHLTELGWSDVMLTEKIELTSGSTWHAAGNLPHFSNSFSVMKLQQYSIALYQHLHESAPQGIGKHTTGAIRLAHTQARMDEFKRVAAMAEMAGLNLTMVTNQQLEQRFPNLNTQGLLGGLWDPDDGHIDPTSVTNAMAALARKNGATIVRGNPVYHIEQCDNGRWRVTTEKGVIDAGIIVNAAGFRCNEVAQMIGHQLPVTSMEHQYLVTEAIDGLDQEQLLPMLRDPDISYYLRQEGKGLIIGPYERGGVAWATEGVPKAFGQELLAPDLDRIGDILCQAAEQVPLFATAGIKTVVNGPITYTPDGHPLIGPVAGYDNYFACTGFNFGIVQGGGAGHFLSQWIVNGHPEIDLYDLDPRRFGDYADREYTLEKAIEVYANEYQLGFNNEYAMRPTQREKKTSPSYPIQKAQHGVFGAYYGWERASWFANDSQSAKEQYSFRRGNWFEHVAKECWYVQHRAGLIDLTPFTKFDISGSDAEAFLSSISPNVVPTQSGKITLFHPLYQDGAIAWEGSLTLRDNGHYYLMGPAAAEQIISDYLHQHLGEDMDVCLKNTTRALGTLVIAGPHSRAILCQLTDNDICHDAFPWFSGQRITIAGVELLALRMNFVGELGWELHHPIEHQAKLYQALMEAGQAFELKPFGLRAMDSMRLEKGYPIWGHELTLEYNALEAGLSPFIKLDKEAFIGQEALKDIQQQGVAKSLKLIEVKNSEVDCQGMEPVYCQGQIVGHTTSGGYGYRCQKSLALAYINRAYLEQDLQVKILDKPYSVEVLSELPYDAKSQRVKA